MYLRHRQYGYYFHFKLLAFIGPLVMVMAAVGAARLRRWGAVALAVLAVATAGSAVAELAATGSQLPQATIQLASWAPLAARGRLGPAGHVAAAAAVGRLLPALPRRLCSQLPLLDTDYPHVAVSRKADYIVATQAAGRPVDAVGPVLRHERGLPPVPREPGRPRGRHCTQRRYDRIYTGIGWSPR